MSGGSYDYAYSRVEDMAGALQRQELPERRAFGAHLAKVAKAMHDIEWVDSCDKSPGDELAAIRAVFDDTGAFFDAAVIREQCGVLRAIADSAEKLLARLDRITCLTAQSPARKM